MTIVRVAKYLCRGRNACLGHIIVATNINRGAPMASLLKLSRVIDFITEWTGRIFAWTIFLAIVVSAINALLRYFHPVWSSNGWL